MAKPSEINRLRPPYLRVLAGGAHAPVENIDARLTAAAKASTLMRAAICVLLLPLLLSSVLAVSLYLQIDRLLPLTLPFVTASAALVALGTLLAARALKGLLQFENRAARRVQRSQSYTPRRHGGLEN